jgi:hypothetical protein
MLTRGLARGLIAGFRALQVQVIGVLTAAIAGVIATRANYRTRQGTR